MKQTQNDITTFLADSKGDLVKQIDTEGAVTDSVEAGLKEAFEEFKAQN